MGKRYSGKRPQNQPIFTRPDLMDFDKRRLFLARMSGSPTPHPTLTPSISVTYTIAASNAPAAWKARADAVCTGTNDHLYIQGGLDAGYDVLISPGTFNIESSLTLDSYNFLRGCGRGSILTTTTADVDIITAIGSSGSEKTGILLADFCVDGNAGGETNDVGIWLDYVDYSVINNVWSIDNGEEAIYVSRSDYNIISGNICGNSGADCDNIMLFTSTHNVIRDNYCYSSSGSDGIAVETNSNYNTVVGNRCYGNHTAGIGIVASAYNTISENICDSTTRIGIFVAGSSNTVMANICISNGEYGIEVYESSYNVLNNNNCQLNGYHGIYTKTSHHNTITGNFASENSQDTDNTYDDICLDASDYNNIQGNTCRAGGETNKPRYGINVSGATCDGNKIINNDLYDDGFVTAPYNNAGTGTIYLEPEDTRDFLKYFGDRTLFSGGAITAHGDADGSVAIASCTAWSKETDSDTADGVFFSYAGKAKQTLTDLSVNLIYLDYNAGTPQIVVATTPVTYGFQQDHILIGVVFRQGTAVHIFQSDNIGIQGINRAFMHAVEYHGAHRSSGLVTSDGGTLALSITAGIIYAGLNRQATTVDGSTWSYWWTDDSGSTWTEDTGISALTQEYNNIASGKVSLGTGKYGVHWVYVDYEGSHCHIVYGQGNYNANQAEEATVPAVLPPIVVGYGVLIAKIISHEGTNDLVITYPWTDVFTSSIATDHGSLGGLADDDHTQYIKHSLATAVSNFLVASGAGVFIKKTLAEVKTLLGIAADIATHAAIKSAKATLGHVIVEDASKVDVDGDGKLTLGSDVLLEADLENPPTEDESTKAPTSEWAYGHNDAGLSATVHAKVTGAHISQDFGASATRLRNIIATPIAGEILRILNCGGSCFAGDIDDNAGAHGGQGLDATHVPYDGDTYEDMFKNMSAYDGSDYWGQIILHNTTRSNSRKIVSADLVNKVLVTSASADDWADDDVITTESQTNEGSSTLEFFDIDISDFVGTSVDAIILFIAFDNQTAGGDTQNALFFHPYETYNMGKRQWMTSALASQKNTGSFTLAVISQKITVCAWQSGTNDNAVVLAVKGTIEFADT